MPKLNYSKWDQLELSDDSDIEGHPNVDHKSLVRWKQRDIHEKREARKHKIASLQAQIACNKVLLPRIADVADKISSSSTDATPATVYFNNLISRLQTNPSKDCPPGNDPNKLEHTYDGMLLSLLKMVTEKAKERAKAAGVMEEARLGKELEAEMAMHVKQLTETIEKDQKELEDEEVEKHKKITMDDLYQGFESKYIRPKPEPEPIPIKGATEAKGKGKEKETIASLEVLNPKGVESGTVSSTPDLTTTGVNDGDDGEEGLPQITPSLEAFSKIGLGQFEESFQFIQQHRDVYVQGSSDALFIQAFEAESEGKKKYAKQCIHQSLLLQYCEKLGKDGPTVFFKKMISGDTRAVKVFQEDLEQTYQHVVKRVAINKEQQAREQIQLVPEDPSTTISFNVPTGPPPENLVLEGPGTEDLDIEEVRKALQFKWDVFQGFRMELQDALTKGELDGVNKVLGNMEVAEAEGVVQSLDAAGIMSFAEGGIRDESGQKEALGDA